MPVAVIAVFAVPLLLGAALLFDKGTEGSGSRARSCGGLIVAMVIAAIAIFLIFAIAMGTFSGPEGGWVQ